MSKEDAATIMGSRYSAYGAPQGALGGVIGDAMPCMSMGVEGRVMPGELLSTTLVRLSIGGQLVGQLSKLPKTWGLVVADWVWDDNNDC